ncbi:MAG: hypothetical protein QNL68_07830, partial [Akkermansiaceae bacterium]
PHNESGALKRSKDADTGGTNRALSQPSVVRVPFGYPKRPKSCETSVPIPATSQETNGPANPR